MVTMTELEWRRVKEAGRALQRELAVLTERLEELQRPADGETYLIEYLNPAESARVGREIWRIVRLQRPIESAENARYVATTLATETKIPHRAVKVVAVQVVVTAGLNEQTER